MLESFLFRFVNIGFVLTFFPFIQLLFRVCAKPLSIIKAFLPLPLTYCVTKFDTAFGLGDRAVCLKHNIDLLNVSVLA